MRCLYFRHRSNSLLRGVTHRTGAPGLPLEGEVTTQGQEVKGKREDRVLIKFELWILGT